MSLSPWGRSALRIPRGNDTHKEIRSAVPVKRSVAGTRSMISEKVLLPCTYETPRSPEKTLEKYVMSCCGSGWSRPNL